MALVTTLYFDSATTPNLPATWAYDPSTTGGCGVWDSYGEAVSRSLNVGSAGASAYANLAASSTNSETVLIAQYAVLLATGTVFTAGSDSISLQVLSRYVGAAPIDSALVWIGVVNQAGTAILATLSNGIEDLSSGTNLNQTNLKNHTWISSSNSYTASYTTTGPAWYVIEVGFSSSTAVSAITGTFRVGEGSGSGSNLAVNETATADGLPWIKHNSGTNDPLVAGGCRMEGDAGVRTW